MGLTLQDPPHIYSNCFIHACLLAHYRFDSIPQRNLLTIKSSGSKRGWGLRLWQAEQAQVWEPSWYWQGLPTLWTVIVCLSQYKIPWWTTAICNHKSSMSPWAEILVIYRVKYWEGSSIKKIWLAQTSGKICFHCSSSFLHTIHLAVML